MFSSADIGIIGHLQAVGHVTGEADIEDGCADAVVLDNIDNRGNEGACLPGKGAAWFENHAQMRPAGAEVAKGLDEELDVVSFARHQMTTAEVNPLQTGKPGGEFLHNMFERPRKSFS